MYASCVDYEVRRREVREGDICGGWGIGDVDCILLYMIYFGDELGIWGLLGLVSWVGYVGYVGLLGGVRCASLA